MRAAAPGLFEVRWENILAHLSDIKKRATVEDRRLFSTDVLVLVSLRPLVRALCSR